MLSDARRQHLQDLYGRITKGPWEWFGHKNTYTVHLATKFRGRTYVMKMKRWGFTNAQPWFQGNSDLGIIEPFTKFIDGNNQISGINHPDAQVIAEAPELLRELLDANNTLDRIRLYCDYCDQNVKAVKAQTIIEEIRCMLEGKVGIETCQTLKH
jgi:hypothetical protein